MTETKAVANCPNCDPDGSKLENGEKGNPDCELCKGENLVEIEAAPEEVIEEVSPLDMIEMLSDDLATALTALKEIVRIKPHLLPGGVNNQNFGRKHIQAFEKAQDIALNAVLKIKEER